MRKIYAASWKLFTLTAEADRVLCQLVMFLTVFFLRMYKIKYSCCHESSVIHGWFVCLLKLGCRKKTLSDFLASRSSPWVCLNVAGRNANRMAPKNSTELSDSMRIKNRSIEVNLEIFFLFVTLWIQNYEWEVYPRARVAVIKPPVTWEKFDLPGRQILSCDRAKIEHERRMTTIDSYFLLRK